LMHLRVPSGTLIPICACKLDVAGVSSAQMAMRIVKRRHWSIYVVVMCEQEWIEADSQATEFLKDSETNV
jgi:hypothetical protein